MSLQAIFYLTPINCVPRWRADMLEKCHHLLSCNNELHENSVLSQGPKKTRKLIVLFDTMLIKLPSLSPQILQVNLVMSSLLYVMFLAYLYGISASTMDKLRPTQDPINTLIIKLLQADISRSRQKQDDTPPSSTLNPPAVTDYKENISNQSVADISTELLRQHKRYNSPRVLLSDRPPLQPPPLYLMDDFVSNQDGSDANKTRQKRNTEHKSYRGEFSVCDSISLWVTDRTTAVDIRGQVVKVLGSVNAGRTFKQYFYETRCNTGKSQKGSCRGIDEKHWNSQCKTSQTFVRAFTQDESMVEWRWIRIDTSCVCALSRKHRRTWKTLQQLLHCLFYVPWGGAVNI